MTKDTIKYLISYYQDFATNVNLTRRLYDLEPEANYVFVGLRRAGKSYLMFQRIAELIAEGHRRDEILYFNFEDDRIDTIGLADLDLIKQCYEEMYEYQPIFFLDEVQNIIGWEKFARRLADTGYRVYVTGSNAKMLSSEIATTLGGRYLVKDIYPFSFTEYSSFRGVDLSARNVEYRHKTEIARYFGEYISFGGLPDVLAMRDKRSWLSSLFTKIFFGDMVSRHQLRNPEALRLLVRKLAESVMQPTSYNRMAQVVSSVGRKVSVDTVIDYIGYMRESWLILPVENIMGKMRDKETVKKYYFIDNGILNLFILNPEAALLENLVAVTLIRRYGSGVYFYGGNVEVDFVVPEAHLAVQVCYSLVTDETRRRETQALAKFSTLFDGYECLIVMREGVEEEVVVSGTRISIVSADRWVRKMELNQLTISN